MRLKDYFEKQIDRPIETVIKAEDQEHILTEVDEYIVTDEIAKKIADFFSLYNDFNLVNGVWISGFFGSGKSHLLKILSYVLENREYDGVYLGKLFAEKIVQDQMLRADVERAIQIPSDSILFNIDQQAQITSEGDDACCTYSIKIFRLSRLFGSKRHAAELNCGCDDNTTSSASRKRAGESWYEEDAKFYPKTKACSVLAG